MHTRLWTEMDVMAPMPWDDEAMAVLRQLGVTPERARALIDEYIEPDWPGSRRFDNVRIKGAGPQVRAIIEAFFVPDVDPAWV